MDFKQLEAFINVAKYKNFSKAARVLYISQPTVSLHIANLEKELGVILFDRTSKEVNLTSSGKDFLSYALDLVNMKTKAIHDLTSSGDHISGSVTIAACTTPSLTIIPDMITTFVKSNPSVQFIIEEKNSNDVVESIGDFTAEVGFIGNHVENDRYITYPIFEDDIVFFCSKDANIPNTVTFEELKKVPLIQRHTESATRVQMEKTMEQLKFDYTLFYSLIETDDSNLLLSLVSKNLGFSYISKKLYEKYVLLFPIKAFTVEGFSSKRSIEMIINKKRTLSPSVEEFVRLVISSVDQYSPQ